MRGRVYIPKLDRYIEYILLVKKAAKDMVRLVHSPHVAQVEMNT